MIALKMTKKQPTPVRLSRFSEQEERESRLANENQRTPVSDIYSRKTNDCLCKIMIITVLKRLIIVVEFNK